MMFLALLGILLPFTTALQLSYSADGSGDIASLTFIWSNPDISGIAEEIGPNDPTIVTDGKTSTGEILTNPNAIWGSVTNPTGMTGTFEADALNVPTGYQWWSITKAILTFTTTNGACFGASSSATLYYANADTGAAIDAHTVDASVDGTQLTLTATLSEAATNGPIGFYVTTNAYCSEAEILVTEFELFGTIISSPNPTPGPTQSPTKSCSGSITVGDPHYFLMAMDDSKRFDYQGHDWHYYLFPCDIASDYEDWPFFYAGNHGPWRNNDATILIMNRLILNTKPDPWIIDFNYDSTLTIEVGTDRLQRSSSDFDTSTKYKKRNPLSIFYDDNQANPQKGELRIYYKDDLIYVELHDVQYNGYPRQCRHATTGVTAYDKDCGDYVCDGQVLQIVNKGYWSVVACPTCLRNIVCGLLGRYIRGDCSKTDIADPNHECYNILLGSDGEVYTPASDGNSVFVPFASTWTVDAVDAVLAQKGLTGFSFQKSHAYESETEHVEKQFDGRTMVASDYLGDCVNNEAKIREVNETCRVNTVLHYEQCCAEIGSNICQGLWDACTYDLCACIGDDGTGNMLTEEYCLDVIVHESMNTSCSFDGFHPTASPTGAPTQSPIKTPGPKVTKVQKLIGLYAFFLALFAIIAIGAYCYYKKKIKNSAKVYVPEEEAEEEAEEAEMVEEVGKTTTA